MTFTAESFWSKVDRSGGPDACWPWTGAINKRHGYGHASIGCGRTGRAHRVAFELAKGPVPGGLIVMHSCNNRPCCNPKHLSAGTHSQNSRYAFDLGRLPTVFRKGRPGAIDPEVDAEVARMFLAGVDMPTIARTIRVTRNTVSAALARRGLRERLPAVRLDETAILERYTNSESAAAIALSVGSSKQAIYKILDRNGVSPRKKYRSLTMKESA